MNTVHSRSPSGDDQYGFGTWHPAPKKPVPPLSSELNRVLCAAVVNAAFCRLLLSDPLTAVARGYNGESFEIGADELARIVAIKARSLAEFASRMLDVQQPGGDRKESLSMADRWQDAETRAASSAEPAVVYSAATPNLQ